MHWLYRITVAAAAFAASAQSQPILTGPAVSMSPAGGTYPRANVLQDGSILGAIATTIDGTKTLALVASDDNGQSWHPRGSASSRPANTSDLDNPYPLQLPNGRILLAYRNHDMADGAYTYFRLTVSYSDDNGATWSYLSTPSEEPAGPNGIWEPFLRNAADGTLQLYYSKLNGDDDQNSILRIRSDGGLTWSEERTISGDGITARDGMLGVAQLPGGSKTDLIAVFESLPVGGTFSVHAISSFDDGMHWQDRRLIYEATGERNNAGAPQVINVGGSICVSFMTDEDTQLHDWVHGAGTKLLVSSNGIRFDEKKEVLEPESFWPGLLALNKSALLYLADRGGAKAQTVVVA